MQSVSEEEEAAPPAWGGELSAGTTLRVGVSDSGRQGRFRRKRRRWSTLGPTPDLAPPAIAAQWLFDLVGGGASRSSGVGQSEGDPVSQPFPGSLLSHEHGAPGWPRPPKLPGSAGEG